MTGRGLLIILALAAATQAFAQTPPWAATPAMCIDHYRRTLVFLRNNAAQAEVNSADMNSLGNEDTYQPPDPNCAKPIADGSPGLEQRDAQSQVALVNRCAIKTTICTIQKVKAGVDCMAAVNQCMQSYPIPRMAQ